MTQLLHDRDWMLGHVHKTCGREAAFAILRVPEHMHQSVLEYLVHGAPVGDFLTAVFSNDFKETCGRADEENIKVLFQWAQLLHNFPIHPQRGYGSREIVKRWQEAGGLLGLLKHNATQGE